MLGVETTICLLSRYPHSLINAESRGKIRVNFGYCFSQPIETLLNFKALLNFLLSTFVKTLSIQLNVLLVLLFVTQKGHWLVNVVPTMNSKVWNDYVVTKSEETSILLGITTAFVNIMQIQRPCKIQKRPTR